MFPKLLVIRIPKNFNIFLIHFWNYLIMISYVLKTKFWYLCIKLIIRFQLLRLSRASQSYRVSAGHLVNLMSNDVSRFDMASEYLNFIWIMPIQGVIIAYVIYRSVGVAMFAGVSAIVIQSVPLQSKYNSKNICRVKLLSILELVFFEQ